MAGVILTHGSLAISAYSNTLGTPMSPNICILSYLPLAHIYEVIIVVLYHCLYLMNSFQRVVELSVVTLGGCIGFFTGDPLRLLEDAQFLKPHYFPAVPRVLNRVYQSAMAAGNAPGLKGALFRMAVQTKLDQLHKTGINTHPLWDFLVFSKVCDILEDRDLRRYNPL